LYNVQILFFAKQDDFGNFHFVVKSKVKNKNLKLLMLYGFPY